MNARTVFFTLTSLVAIAGVVGCKTAPPSGVVGWRGQFNSGSFAPDLPILTTEGKDVRFHNVREPVAILVFTEAVKPCDALNAHVSRLSERLQDLPVTIVQISLPTEECPPAVVCCKSLPSSVRNIMCLYDTSHVAWDAYKQPAVNTLVLIDPDNKVVDIKTIGQSKALEDKAVAMASEIYDEWDWYDPDD